MRELHNIRGASYWFLARLPLAEPRMRTSSVSAEGPDYLGIRTFLLFAPVLLIHYTVCSIRPVLDSPSSLWYQAQG
jgi:hypothetical protein